MTEKIKILMIKSSITQGELAERLKISQPTLSNKFKLDNWRDQDLIEIAKVCNCKYEGNFILNDERI